MDVPELFEDLMSRVQEHVHEVSAGLSPADLLVVPEAGSNPIGWLLWHLTRVQDAHMAELVEREQVWMEDGWAARFGVEADPSDVGFGHTPEQVARVRPESVSAVTGYYDAVAERTRAFVATLTPEALDRVVDRSWDPPVTLGVRLVSVLDDDIQHAGQAAYVRGLLERRSER
ncbi:mycothiol transferase [Rhabdothermincola salaria]|uniref:mycothiol transferase n=1 Tax=Rhabdothermincola salaria TaxID=2903142 RepID=UPI001E5D33B0|nr:DUF664 domain-containing protein [Rhabdothermincola salaria]MCD9625673.1 DinB family protein [Rhabdothermincola salaria]